MNDTEKIFILTDLCMWEKNKVEGKNAEHAIIVIDEETGQNRMIKGGSKIRFVDGEISLPQSQEDYNNQPKENIDEHVEVELRTAPNRRSWLYELFTAHLK
jgi:hypothetical protein